MKTIIAKEDNTATILSLAEIKAHCRITYDDDDALLAIYRSAAVDLIEEATESNLTPTIYEEYYSNFATTLYMTSLPIYELTSISYYDSDNVLQVLDDENYTYFLPDSARGVITLTDNLPETYVRPDAVIVKYQCAVGTVTALLRAAMLLQIGSFYEHRENETEASLKTLSIGVQRIIDLYRETKY